MTLALHPPQSQNFGLDVGLWAKRLALSQHFSIRFGLSLELDLLVSAIGPTATSLTSAYSSVLGLEATYLALILSSRTKYWPFHRYIRGCKILKWIT